MSKEIVTPEIEHAIHRYDLGELRSTSNLNEGYTNKNLHVGTSTGEYVLRVSQAGRTEDEVAFETNVLRKLKQTSAGEFVIGIIETPDGSPFVVSDGRIYTVFRFAKGEDFYSRWDRHNPDTHFIESLGSRSAVLHRGLSDIDKPKTSKEPLPAKLNKYRSELEGLGLNTGHLRNLVEVADGTSLVHTDLRIRNFIVNASEITTILDFDDIAYGNQLYDLAWTIKESFSLQQTDSQLTPMINVDATKLFLKWYQSAAKGKVSVEDVVKLAALACLRTLHFLCFSASNSMTRDRIKQLTSINLAQLDLFTKDDIFASAIIPE